MNKNISYKLFLKLFFSFTIVFLTYHMGIWIFYTSKIFDREDNLYIGDIGRMSYQVDSLFPRKLEYTLEKKHLNHFRYNNENIDILTIGDSFSNAAMGGLNPYYQDFLATKYNANVLNIMKIVNNEHRLFEMIIVLYNNGWLKKYKPKIIIIQSAERGVYGRFAREFDFSKTNLSTAGIITKVNTKDSHIPTLLPINTANYKMPFYTIKYFFNNRAFKNVIKLKLNRNLFTTKNYENQLLFHYSDITSIENNKANIELINYNFNKLSTLLKTLDIQLVFMPVVDKYDLYYDFIVDNPYPKNNFFNLFRPLDRNYLFVDTKKILLPLLHKDIKDLYYSDDTHWSYKASKEIVKNIKLCL